MNTIERIDAELDNLGSDILELMDQAVTRLMKNVRSEEERDFLYGKMEAVLVQMCLHNAAEHEALRHKGNAMIMRETLYDAPTSIAITAELMIEEGIEDLLNDYAVGGSGQEGNS